MHGEEVEIDISSLESVTLYMYMYIVCHVHEFTHNLVNMEAPVMWVRVDPEIKCIR